VVRAIERLCTRETGTPEAYNFFIIEGCEAVYSLAKPTEQDLDAIGAEALDATTLQITLTEPASYFLTLTSMPQMRPVPGELIEDHGSSWRTKAGELADGWQTPENIVTNGPFIPSAAVFSDESFALHKNPLWPLNRPGNIDVVNIAYEQNEDDIFKAWGEKTIDLSPLPVDERESFLAQTPVKARLITNQTAFYVGFNFDSIVFREPEARRAFAAAIDRTKLIDFMFQGRAQELQHLTPPGVFGAPPVDEVGVGYSPDFARHQMSSSSFRNCKLIPEISFLVSTADLSLLQAELLRSMWKTELECDEKLINIVQDDFGALLSNTSPASASRPDLWELAWPPTYPDAHNVLTDLLHCTEGENRQNRTCSEVDRLLRQAAVTPQPEERQALYRDAENLFFGEAGLMPMIPLYVRGDYILVQNWLTLTPALTGGEQFDTYIIDEELKRLEQSRG
jgi:ABC-type oligopeptide transport system substrate-binding subunit